jgi:hypothetical protein
MTDQYDRERAAFEEGTCSRCGGRAERGRLSGAWWHVDMPCAPDFEWWVPARFLAEGQRLPVVETHD